MDIPIPSSGSSQIVSPSSVSGSEKVQQSSVNKVQQSSVNNLSLEELASLNQLDMMNLFTREVSNDINRVVGRLNSIETEAKLNPYYKFDVNAIKNFSEIITNIKKEYGDRLSSLDQPTLWKLNSKIEEARESLIANINIVVNNNLQDSNQISNDLFSFLNAANGFNVFNPSSFSNDETVFNTVQEKAEQATQKANEDIILKNPRVVELHSQRNKITMEMQQLNHLLENLPIILRSGLPSPSSEKKKTSKPIEKKLPTEKINPVKNPASSVGVDRVNSSAKINEDINKLSLELRTIENTLNRDYKYDMNAVGELINVLEDIRRNYGNDLSKLDSSTLMTLDRRLRDARRNLEINLQSLENVGHHQTSGSAMRDFFDMAARFDVYAPQSFSNYDATTSNTSLLQQVQNSNSLYNAIVLTNPKVVELQNRRDIINREIQELKKSLEGK